VVAVAAAVLLFGHVAGLDQIRRALQISEGDEVEFAVHDDGTITVRGYVSIPTDQAWFFTPQWLAGEREPTRTSPQAGEPCMSPPMTCLPTLTRSARQMPDADV